MDKACLQFFGSWEALFGVEKWRRLDRARPHLFLEKKYLFTQAIVPYLLPTHTCISLTIITEGAPSIEDSDTGGGPDPNCLDVLVAFATIHIWQQ